MHGALTLLAVYSIGTFVLYAAQAAHAREWKTCGAYIITVASVVAVGGVALIFNT